MCPACAAGDLSQCWSFAKGDLAPGIHTGMCKDVPGGFGELMPAHDSMLFKVPDAITDEQAVFADPFAVSLHGITRHPPRPGSKVLVYGAGALGTSAVAILRALYPDVEVMAVARFDAQRRLAEHLGATTVAPEPRDDADRGGRGLVGWRAATGRRAPDGVPGWDRRRVRHHRRGRDARGRCPRCCGPAARW